MPDYPLPFSDPEQDLLDLQRRIREVSEREDALCERLRGIDEGPDATDALGEHPSDPGDRGDSEDSPDGDVPCDLPMAGSTNDGQNAPAPTDIVIHEDSESPVPHGCHRVIKTYDNGVPIAWVDVPDGELDPEPMYLCTEAARIYMMSDDEYAEHERMRHGESEGSVPPPSVKAAATTLLMLPCMWVIFVVTCLMLGPVHPAFLVVAGTLLLAATVWALAKIVRYPGLAKTGKAKRHFGAGASRQALPSDQGDDVGDACALLSEHVGHANVGTLAEDGLRQVDDAATRREQVMSLVDEAFSPGSLSWDRFAGTVDGTCDAIGQNVVAMADDLRAYDEMRRHGEATRHLPMARMRDERRQAEDGLITSMHRHVQDNEALLLELDKLRQELLRLKDDRQSEDNTTALEEIRRLVSETPEYR